jgi:hypothetical protein
VKKERLAAEEAMAAKRAEAARIVQERERVEHERLLGEHLEEQRRRRQEEEKLSSRCKESAVENAAALDLTEREELERDGRSEHVRLVAEAKALAAQQYEAEIAKEVHSHILLVDKLNEEARAVSDQLSLVQEERNHLQRSNNELQTLCEQLRDDLHRAAEAISNLKEDAADQTEKERLRWEKETRRAEEEESNLLAATKLDMELQMTNLRESMQSQIDSLEGELTEERKSSINQQHALQRRLEEAMARISASESEVMALASKKEAKATSKLQATEKAAAKAVALLDKKEEEVQQLQQVITDSETSFFAVWLRRDGTS